MATIADFPATEVVTQSLPKITDTAVVVPSIPAQDNAGKASEGGITMTIKGDKIHLSGNVTRQFQPNLKKLNGSFDKVARAWVFDLSNQGDINTFLEGVSSGQIKPEPFVGYVNKKQHQNGGFVNNKRFVTVQPGQPTQPGQQPVIPVYNPTGYVSNMRLVGPWNVFVPTAGMVAKIQVGNYVFDRRVVSAEGDTNKGYIVMVVDEATGNQSRLAPSNGHWEVRGMMDHHTVRFNTN